MIQHGAMMKKFAEAVLDAIMERQIEEVFVAIAVGLALSLCLSGLYMLARRRVSDILTLLVSLMLLASIVSATLTIGYIRYDRRRVDISRWKSPLIGPQSGWETAVAQLYVRMSDEDHDGIISADEMSRMTARMVKQAKTTGSSGVLPNDQQSSPAVK
jgi:hypothetical protein